jgi:hypothetical protein
VEVGSARLRDFVAIPGMVAAFEVILTLTRILASVRADPEACIDAWTSIRRSGTGLTKAQRKCGEEKRNGGRGGASENRYPSLRKQRKA